MANGVFGSVRRSARKAREAVTKRRTTPTATPPAPRPAGKPSRALVSAFTPTGGTAAQAGAFRGRTPEQQAAANIRTTAQAVQHIARKEDISFAQAGERLRTAAGEISRARTQLQSILSRAQGGRGLASWFASTGGGAPTGQQVWRGPLTRKQVLTALRAPYGFGQGGRGTAISPVIARVVVSEAEEEGLEGLISQVSARGRRRR